MKSAMFLGLGCGFSANLVSSWNQVKDEPERTGVVRMRVIRRADVVHLICRSALHAARDGLLTAQLQTISFEFHTPISLETLTVIQMTL